MRVQRNSYKIIWLKLSERAAKKDGKKEKEKRKRKGEGARARDFEEDHTQMQQTHQWKCADESALRKGIYQRFMWFAIFTFSLSLRFCSCFFFGGAGRWAASSHLASRDDHRCTILLKRTLRIDAIERKRHEQRGRIKQKWIKKKQTIKPSETIPKL